MIAMFGIDSPYYVGRRDFRVERGSLGVSLIVSCVGHEVRVATLEEAEHAITTIIAEQNAQVDIQLANPNIMY